MGWTRPSPPSPPCSSCSPVSASRSPSAGSGSTASSDLSPNKGDAMAALVAGRLADRIALVTGAANGIGRASALRLAREGADLVVVDREGDPLQVVAREIEATGREVLPITV